MGLGRGTGALRMTEPNDGQLRPLVDRYALLEYAAAYEVIRCTDLEIVKQLQKMALGQGVAALDCVFDEKTLPLSLTEIAANIEALQKQYRRLSKRTVVSSGQAGRFELLAQGGIPKVYKTDRFFTDAHNHLSNQSWDIS